MTLHKRRELMEDCNLWEIEKIWRPADGRKDGWSFTRPCKRPHSQAHGRSQKTFLEKRIWPS
jgi:hypothetical protein